MQVPSVNAQIALTPEKNLHTGPSVWSSTAHPPLRCSALKRSEKCDLVIVGAGISGAFMAEAMSRRFERVLVLDRRPPGMGSTHASTAMLQYEIDTPLIELSDKIGHAKAARAWRLSHDTTQALIALVRKERIPCGLEDRQSLYMTGNSMGARAMAVEQRARKRAGLDCEFLHAPALRARFDIDRTGAILSPGAAVADPVALARGLLRRARARGTRIFTPCDVTGVLANHSGVVLEAGGHFIEAKAAIFCTGYEKLRGLPNSGTKITSSWAAATAPHADFPPWLNQTLVWEAADPYLYMRTDPQGRLIVGGEDADLDQPIYRARTLGMKGRKLAGKTRDLLGGPAPKWRHVWAGAFGESRDGLPVIDAVPGLPHCFAVMGFGGNGTIYSLMAARLMHGLLTGRPSRDAALFRYR